MATSDTLLVFEMAGPLQLAGSCAALALAWFLSWLGLRVTASRGRRTFLLALRGLTLLTLGFLLLKPALQHRTLTPFKSRVAVLVDASESMGIQEGGGSRADQAAKFLENNRRALDRLQTRHAVEYYTFEKLLKPATLQQLGKRADGERTDILAALSSLAGEPEAGKGGLAAVVLVSDGTDTERLGRLGPDDPLPEQAEKILSSLATAVNTFLAGGKRRFADLAVSDVVFDDFAFIRNAVELEVWLSSVGLKETMVPVVLEQGGRNLASQVVKMPENGSQKVVLRFVPDRVGKFVYRITVPVLEGETIAENNTRSIVTRVIRDKIRVLHLVGRPSWDQRFLREILKRNPNVDLVSFYILRTTVDAPAVSEDQLSLIPFPVSQLFGSELDTFDVVIFQNFNHGPYLVGYYLPQLVQYVRRGGAFCMVGGDLSFGAGGYANTDLEQILPVRLRGGDDWRLEEFRAVLNPEGSSHPVLDLGDPALWKALPALGSFNQAQSVAPDAVVLLVHPFERAGVERAPILALRKVDRGRSAALLTDGSWRWNFVYAGQGGGLRPYHNFWNNLLRWLIRDPALHLVSLRSRKASYRPGEALQLKLRVRGMGPKLKANIRLQAAERGEVVLRRSVELNDQGAAEVELPSPGTGAFVVGAELIDKPSIEGAEDALVVEGASVERRRPSPRPDILEKIAKASGGYSGNVEQGSLDDLKSVPQERYRVEASRTRPLLEHWWLLLGLVGLLGVEWWMRRQWGFS